MKTAVCGGQVVFEDGVVPATILINATGTIEGIVATSQDVVADEVIDATGLLVFPGVVDAHTHLNDPGSTASEDFFSGTCGAAAGGVTTVIEMPQTIPIVVDRERFLEKLSIARSKAVVDFALWGAVTAENMRGGESSDLEEMAAEGAIAFKAFTSDSPEQPRIADDLLFSAMRQATDLGLLVGIHCEDQGLIDVHTALLRGQDRNDPLVNPDSRPYLAEVEAVRRVIALGELAGARFHLAHISHPASIDLACEARARGVDVTAETCAHYLTLTRDDVKSTGALAMCNPPLRDQTAVEGLWDRLRAGYIDSIGTDHCAYTEEEKANPDYWQTPAGISGMQLMFPLIVGRSVSRGVPPSLLARVFAGNPARRFGLYPKKGSLRPGSDADLVLVDPESSWEVQGADLFSKAPGTAYEGFVINASVRRTLVRGQTVFQDGRGSTGRILASAGFGQFQRPLRLGQRTPAATV